ncbi:MAG: ATPase, T2SS/T4P/T4SS family [Gemmatales bacterium]|nr:ATPase, T2SS/T4P/T4SS family [Gemmatales bacterium]MDW8387776.1 ATPase, T2SS/T4P/T4SS family [Gemmatales bacterium]
MSMGKGRGDFTDILIKKGIISRDQLQEATAVQKSTGAKLSDALVKLGYCSAQDVMTAIAEFHNLQFVDLTELTIPAAVVELVPESVARENVILPLAQDNGTLKIIMSDPMDLDTIQKLQFILNKDIQPVLAPREQIIEAINRYYGQSETESVDSMLQEFTDTAIDTTETESAQRMAEMDDSDAPVVKLVNLIIQEAISLRASDIHIEPFADRIRVRYRIDGVLVERDSPPKRLLPAILSRIKIMGNIDIAEKRRPQDGRIKMVVNGKHFDLRVSILPTNHGQACCMRILDRSSIQVNIRDLGFADDDYQRFQQIIKRPNGIFLVTGPTGSGKTTTLYAALNELNRPDRKIITAEDPVEYYLPGVNQVEVKHQIGLDFARIIRAMLRQAPNIILVGEIRDCETAEIAIQASLTGHLVFSTLHTNDAPSAITRLIDIGIQPFLVASSLIAIMAQRLVRVVCPKCKEPDQPSMAEIRAAGLTPDRLANATFMRGRGCSHCHHTGYRGRTGIFEMMKMNSTLREMTFRREPTQAIRRQARLLGMRTLLEDGVNKALRGITTLEEVLSTCHHESALV